MPVADFRRMVRAADGEMVKSCIEEAPPRTLTDLGIARRALDAVFHDWPGYFKPKRVVFLKSTRLEPRLRRDGVRQRYLVRVDAGHPAAGGGAKRNFAFSSTERL